MTPESQRSIVVVTGDVIIEWRLARAKIGDRQDAALLDPRTYIQGSRAPSGAITLAELIDAALPIGDLSAIVLRRSLGEFGDYPLRGPFWNSYVLCAQYPMRKDDRESDGRAAWRVEKKLGLDRMPFHEYEKAQSLIPGDTGAASLVVVDLAMQGFEEQNASWPLALTEPKGDPWLLVRWSRPQMYATTKAWERMLAQFENRIVIVTSADHLRFYGLRISRGLSWERTVEDLWKHVDEAWAKSLAGCRHFIVSFVPSGAVIFTKTEGSPMTAKLVYDPAEIESSWADDYDGEMMGYTRCLTAGIALEMLGSRRRGKMDGHGIVAGMAASRHLLAHGFRPDDEVGRPDTRLPKALHFPTHEIATILRDALSYSVRARRLTDRPPARHEGDLGNHTEAAKFQIETVPANQASEPDSLSNWRISTRKLRSTDEILRRGRDMVEFGIEDITWEFPTLSIGKLFVTAREEIENLRTVRELIVDYIKSPAIAKPLSIAVFGKPGSGKSFAIKELAKDLTAARHGGPKLEEVTFNISQFTGPDSIAGALHVVRDIGLSGKLPLVFWDEFDTNRGGEQLGWLQYFLAPMQDGQFQHGQVVHNIGRAIFVFAGGTNETMKHFRKKALRDSIASSFVSVVEDSVAEDDDDDEVRPDVDEDQYKRWAKEAKVPDFLSRLKGFVNIPTLNHPRQESAGYSDAKLDAAVVLRRAHLLRSFLLDSPGDLVRIVQSGEVVRKHLNADVGLVNAFLSVPRFKFGARSLEAIVKMSVLAGKKMYDRSSLPPLDQLSLHVKALEFFQCVDRYKGSHPRPM